MCTLLWSRCADSFIVDFPHQFSRLCLVPEKYEGKKIKRKSRKKEKYKKINIDLNLINYFRLCLVPGKLKRKCEGKKIKRKSGRKEKIKENKK